MSEKFYINLGLFRVFHFLFDCMVSQFRSFLSPPNAVIFSLIDIIPSLFTQA